MSTTPHALYRFFADDGRLLYVGITNNPNVRFPQHAQDKPWWHEVRGITLETYPDRDAVLAAEARVVKVEQPLYNKHLRRIPVSAHAAPAKPRKAGPPPEILWSCGECQQPVTGESGYIHVSLHAVDAVEEAWRAWEQRRAQEKAASPRPYFEDVAGYLELPPPVRWQVHHGECDPNPDDYDYWFHVNRARTHAHLLSWTGHFMETKDWIRHTDWNNFIRRVAGVPEA